MEYTQSLDEALRVAKATLGLMAKNNIPPNPHNFTIWYHYASDSYPELKQTINILIENKKAFTELRNSQLFEKYFTFENENNAAHDIAEKIEAAMEDILGHLGNAGSEAKEFGQELNAAAEELSGGSGEISDGGGLADAFSSIVAATRQMEQRTRDLEDRLAASSQEVTQLKGEVEESRREASTDPLTGIANRKMFDTSLRKAIMDAMETGDSLCLLMVDIDHFKKFNDDHGHQLGDQVLKLLALTLEESIKGKDTAARYGGEEFTVVLPGISRENAVALAEQIRRRLATKNIINRKTGRPLGNITLSIGVSQFRPGEPMDQLISRADAALYWAKGQGRNRVMSELDLQTAEAGG